MWAFFVATQHYTPPPTRVRRKRPSPPSWGVVLVKVKMVVYPTVLGFRGLAVLSNHADDGYLSGRNPYTVKNMSSRFSDEFSSIKTAESI